MNLGGQAVEPATAPSSSSPSSTTTSSKNHGKGSKSAAVPAPARPRAKVRKWKEGFRKKVLVYVRGGGPLTGRLGADLDALRLSDGQSGLFTPSVDAGREEWAFLPTVGCTQGCGTSWHLFPPSSLRRALHLHTHGGGAHLTQTHVRTCARRTSFALYHGIGSRVRLGDAAGQALHAVRLRDRLRLRLRRAAGGVPRVVHGPVLGQDDDRARCQREARRDHLRQVQVRPPVPRAPATF